VTPQPGVGRPHWCADMTPDEEEPGAFSREVGRRLRAVRRAKQLSLDDVERTSDGRWSASAIGAYERGFRNLSLPRLHELAAFYDVPMSVLLGEDVVAAPPSASTRMILDMTALADVPEAGPVVRYLRTIVAQRSDFDGRILSIRRDDVRVLCAVLRLSEDELLEQLRSWHAVVTSEA
jgi:transcriptional regulator with XRE-family HTH domain